MHRSPCEPVLTATCNDSPPGDPDQWPRPVPTSQPGDARTDSAGAFGFGWPWQSAAAGRAVPR